MPYWRSASASISHDLLGGGRCGASAAGLYSATKGALTSLALAMAADHVADGIGSTRSTPALRHPLGAAAARRRLRPGAERRALEARQPIGRLVSVDEVAEAIAYLASPLSASTTATVWRSTAGMTNLRLRAPGTDAGLPGL
jgi:NAD(P)-dependent dehydrogenase (short-subunit alcohol dehydrogenase family)